MSVIEKVDLFDIFPLSLLFDQYIFIKFYFALPYTFWERGLNENPTGLIRQYFPKGSDYAYLSEGDLQMAIDRLSNRLIKLNELIKNQHNQLQSVKHSAQ